MAAFTIRLTEAEREELTARAKHGRGSADVARRAQVVLMIDARLSYEEIRGLSRGRPRAGGLS